MSGTIDHLIAHRLGQARDSIREADVLRHSGMSARSVLNRLYYAMFYTVLALLQDRGLGTSKHAGAIALFDREYVKTGVFTREMSKALHRAFELRQKGDYLEDAEVTELDVAEIRPLTEQFVASAESYLATRIG